jgi:signal transduction histidine kinase
MPAEKTRTAREDHAAAFRLETEDNQGFISKRMPQEHRRLAIPIALAAQYALVLVFWPASAGLRVAYALSALVAIGCALWAQREIARSGSLWPSLAMILPAVVMTGVFISLDSPDTDRGMCSAAVWPHVIAAGLAVERSSRPGAVRDHDPRLGRLMRIALFIAMALYGVWLILLGLKGRLMRPNDFAFTASVGAFLLYWALETGSETRRAVGAAVRAFLERHDAKGSATGVVASLRASPSVLPVDLPSAVAGVCSSDRAREEGFALLGRVRRVLDLATVADRRLYVDCLIVEKDMVPHGLARLVAELEGTNCERLLLRALLAAPTFTEDDARAARWMAWRVAGDDASSVSRVVVQIEAVLHDVIKHGFGRVARGLETLRSTGQLSEDNRRAADAFLDDLLDRLRAIDARLRAVHVSAGPLQEDVEAVRALRETRSWARAEAVTFDEVVARVRRLLERQAGLLRHSVPAVVRRVVRDVQEGHDVSIDVSVDEVHEDSLVVIALPDALPVIVTNLVQNAAVWAQRSDKPPRVHVEVGLVGDPRRPSVELRVEDSGPGIDPAEHETALHKGRGLGLVQRHLASLRGSSLAIERAKLGGAAFVVRMPSRDV